MENVDRNKFIPDYYMDGQEFYTNEQDLGETIKNTAKAVDIVTQLVISEGIEAAESFMYGYADAAGRNPWNNIYSSMIKVGLTTEEIAVFTIEIAKLLTRYIITRAMK